MPSSVRNTGDVCSIPWSGESPGVGNGNHPSILAWKIPWRRAGGIQFMQLQSQIWLSMHTLQFSSVVSDCLWPMGCSMPGLPIHHQLLEFTQTHVNWVGDAIQPSHSMLSPSPPTFNFSQHQGLFKWVISSHQVAKVLELQCQHHSFQWIFRTDFL